MTGDPAAGGGTVSHDPMAPEALALKELPGWMIEAAWARLDRLGEPRNGEIAQALGLAPRPKPAREHRPPAARDPRRMQSAGAVRLMAAGKCIRGHRITGESDLRFTWRWFTGEPQPRIQTCCAHCDRERSKAYGQRQNKLGGAS